MIWKTTAKFCTNGSACAAMRSVFRLIVASACLDAVLSNMWIKMFKADDWRNSLIKCIKPFFKRLDEFFNDCA